MKTAFILVSIFVGVTAIVTSSTGIDEKVCVLISVLFGLLGGAADHLTQHRSFYDPASAGRLMFSVLAAFGTYSYGRLYMEDQFVLIFLSGVAGAGGAPLITAAQDKVYEVLGVKKKNGDKGDEQK